MVTSSNRVIVSMCCMIFAYPDVCCGEWVANYCLLVAGFLLQCCNRTLSALSHLQVKRASWRQGQLLRAWRVA
jgi:hypothetical protein